MAFFDNIFAGQDGIAQQLLTKLGVDATIEYKATEAYDPLTGTETEDTPEVDLLVKATPPLEYKTCEIDHTSILSGDSKCIVSSYDADEQNTTQLDLERAMRSIIKFSTESYKIIKIDTVYSGDDRAIYQFQLRRVRK